MIRVSLCLAALLAFTGLASANHRTAAGGCNGSQASGGSCSGSQGSGGLLHRNGSILAKFRAHHSAQAPAAAYSSTTTQTTVIRAALPKGPANCTCGAMGCPAAK